MILSDSVSGKDVVLNEMRVLGGLMEFPEAFMLLDWDVDYFDDTLNRLLLEQILLLAERGDRFDRLTLGVVANRLKNPELEVRVYECWVDRGFGLNDLAFWHGLVKKLWAERVIRLTAQGLLDEPDRYVDAIDVLQRVDSGNEFLNTVSEYQDEFVEKRKSGEEIVSTGEPVLDDLLEGGWRPGLYGVAGRMKQGKSVVLLHMARKLAESGGRVLFVSFEMTKDQMMDRLIASITRVDANKVAKHDLDFEVEYEGKIWWAADLVREVKLPESLVIVAPKDRTVNDLRNVIVKTRNRLGGLDAVFVDYAQIMSYKGKYSSKAELNSLLSNQLQALSSLLEIPLITGLQLKRPDGVSDKRVPDAVDIAESDQYARDATAVFYIIRNKMPNDSEWSVGSELLLKLGTGRFVGNGSARFIADDKCSLLTHVPWR